MDLNIDEFEFVPVTDVTTVKTPSQESLIDLEVEGDHTFFIRPYGLDENILVHNCDGSHITAMLIGWFKKFAPNLFDEGRICKLVTPLIIVEDAKGHILHHFMNVSDFKAWEAKNPNNKNKITYLKGLGSWERQQLIELINTYGMENFIVEYKLSEDGNVYIEDWLGNDAEKRKTYLREYTFDINQV